MAAGPPPPVSPTQDVRPISPVSKKPNKPLPSEPESGTSPADEQTPALPPKPKPQSTASVIEIPLGDGDDAAEEIKKDKLKAKELLKRAQEAKAEIDEIKRRAEETQQEAEAMKEEAEKKVCFFAFNLLPCFADWLLILFFFLHEPASRGSCSQGRK